MSTESIRISTVLPAPMKQIYETWLSSEGHSLMTGDEAEIEAEAGGEFTAWDGYISGETLIMEPHHYIVQF